VRKERLTHAPAAHGSATSDASLRADSASLGARQRGSTFVHPSTDGSIVQQSAHGHCHADVVGMSHLDRVLAHVLDRDREASLRFDALRTLLLALGFSERIRGSHHIFAATGVREILNLQQEGRDAKQYQVRQVRRVVLRYNLKLRG